MPTIILKKLTEMPTFHPDSAVWKGENIIVKSIESVLWVDIGTYYLLRALGFGFNIQDANKGAGDARRGLVGRLGGSSCLGAVLHTVNGRPRTP